MQSHLDKVKLVSSLAVTFYEKLQNDLAGLILTEEYEKPANIVETMFFGKAHLNLKFQKILNDKNYSDMLDYSLMLYIWGYFNSIVFKNTPNSKFGELHRSRDKFYKNVLEVFVYNETSELPYKPYATFFTSPLMEPIDEISNREEVPENFLSDMRKYVRFLDIWIDLEKIKLNPVADNNETIDTTGIQMNLKHLYKTQVDSIRTPWSILTFKSKISKEKYLNILNENGIVNPSIKQITPDYEKLSFEERVDFWDIGGEEDFIILNVEVSIMKGVITNQILQDTGRVPRVKQIYEAMKYNDDFVETTNKYGNEIMLSKSRNIIISYKEHHDSQYDFMKGTIFLNFGY